MSWTRWILITGEYPPQPGGVSDYTRLVAHGLAEAGDEVHVWAPAGKEIRNPDLGIRNSSFPIVHRLPGKFGPPDLEILEKALRRMVKPFRMLVQYVPHAFGYKGMNVPLCWWLSRRPEPVWVMFHEVVHPLSRRQPLAHNMLGMVTRFMSELLARRAKRIFVSIPAWQDVLPKSARKSITWLPVPSNIPTTVPPERVIEIRKRIAPKNEVIIGHFGTYGSHVTTLLIPTLSTLLKQGPRRRALLVGRGSNEFATVFGKDNPDVRDRIVATGPLEAELIAAHLSACDCVVQPYSDGVSSRRASLLASLALGLPIVTNVGILTDPIWKQNPAVVMAPAPSSPDLIHAAESLLTFPEKAVSLRHRAADLYRQNFHLSRTIEGLRMKDVPGKLAS